MTGVVYLPRKASRDQIRQNGLVVKAAVEGAFWKIEGVGAGTYEGTCIDLLVRVLNK